MKISWLTRRKSFEEIKPNRKVRYEQILESLCVGNKTAKEIAVELYEQRMTNTDIWQMMHHLILLFKLRQCLPL